jgi:two-component system nitrogen regulation sensor histidine kinase GlnL
MMRALSQTGSPNVAEISWEQILANLEDGVITLDAGGSVLFFNEAAETLTEISSSRAAQRPLEQLFKREPWLIELVQKSQPPRQESVRGEGDFVTRWGQKIPVSLTVSPLQDQNGKYLGSILVLRDIRHRKELEEDLKRADRLASMGTLAAGLAHEIRNPLGGIKGAAQLLRRSIEENASLCRYTDIMIREVDRVNQLIEQLLDLSRPAALLLEPLNIHQVLEDVLLLQSAATEARSIAIRKAFDPSLPPVNGDRARLTQVFLNLVKNAVESMNGSGTITLSTRVETDFHIRDQGARRHRYIWIDVADEGCGIAEDDLPHIFSPFFTTKNSGTGLGLSLSYRLIQEHGGLMRVESAAGKGTTFKVSLLVAD